MFPERSCRSSEVEESISERCGSVRYVGVLLWCDVELRRRGRGAVERYSCQTPRRQERSEDMCPLIRYASCRKVFRSLKL